MPIECSTTPAAPPCPATLERNLAAVARRSPHTARLLQSAAPRTDLEWVDTDEGAPALAAAGRWLCSRRAPLTEGRRLAESIDLADAGAIAVLGFGAGHHVRALSDRAAAASIVIVFEPDLALLRAVLERVDCSAWLGRGNVAIVTDPADRGAVTRAVEGAEALLAMGVKVLAHPPSAPRLKDDSPRFSETLAAAVAALRAQIVTAMVQSEVTVRNALLNADHYAARPGVADLAGRCAGSPAIVVSAGPSLRRNIALLARPGVRERAVIIATQTTLKPLLAEGVRPHFVCALDYHEISRRFYEGLTPESVDGVTLLAEPKANPAILDSFPGAIRCPADDNLDLALGASDPAPRGALRAGATVAHLSHYLARHLGCDPVILVGQDLAFTDGQYYAAGAAIHDVWAGELNPFNTLEMMEWQRIIRSRATLRVARDHLGRRVYTDEQMAAYLAQFERDFAEDAHRALTVIDATEGGVEKRHTAVMSLADAIERFVGPARPLPDLCTPALDAAAARAARRRAEGRLREVRLAAGRLVEVSERTARTLDAMAPVLTDPARLNALIDDAHRLRDEAHALEPAYTLTHRINQAGGFNRIRADRAIHLEHDLPEAEVQHRRIQRDSHNVRWFTDAARALCQTLDAAIAALEGAPKPTRLPAPPAEAALDAAHSPASARPHDARPRVAAIIPFEPGRDSPAALRETINRLRRCASLNEIAILTPDPAALAPLFDPRPARTGEPRVRTLPRRAPRDAGRDRSIRAARAFAPSCWRSGIGGLSVYDELDDPAVLAAALDDLSAGAAALVGPDWTIVDPAWTDAVIERHLERPRDHRLTFTQAPPGLVAACASRELLADLARAADRIGPVATIGGLLTYSPVKPSPDPIAKPVCVSLPACVRDALGRFIADTPARADALRPLAAHFDSARDHHDTLAAALAETDRSLAATGPEHIALDLTPAGDRAIDPSALRALAAHARRRPDAALTIALPPTPHPSALDLVAQSCRLGFRAVHVRASILSDPAALHASLDAGADVLSLDCFAARAESFARCAGADRFAESMHTLEALLGRRTLHRGLPHPWIVPRIERRDETYDDIEPFFDRWLLLAGWAVIDPPRPAHSGRIQPLPLPRAAAQRRAATELALGPDGRPTHALSAAP